MKRFLILLGLFIGTSTLAAEVPLCALPPANLKAMTNNTVIDGDMIPGCMQMVANAQKVAEMTKSSIQLVNNTLIPSQLSVGAVYLQPITMAPAGMMQPREQSDIHLELDIHAKASLKSRGFAPGDWLPNVDATYTIQKISELKPLNCAPTLITCKLMPMVASDGAHYGDNVKLAGPGFYLVTFKIHTDPAFGWHTDTDSKVLGTEFVDWSFTQKYLFKWTGIGKKGGY